MIALFREINNIEMREMRARHAKCECFTPEQSIVDFTNLELTWTIGSSLCLFNVDGYLVILLNIFVIPTPARNITNSH